MRIIKQNWKIIIVCLIFTFDAWLLCNGYKISAEHGSSALADYHLIADVLTLLAVIYLIGHKIKNN